MKIENTEVYGFRAALRAMRNPMDSWEKSDSSFYGGDDVEEIGIATHSARLSVGVEGAVIGPKDLELACKLIRGGAPHRKFLRQIIVWVDFTLPRYVWQEMDTYKVSTVRNSCSTMHKLGHRDLAPEDFADDRVLPTLQAELNKAGRAYREKTDHGGISGTALLRYMKQLLPEGFLQKATWMGSYETLLSMHHWRKNHRLPEWSGPHGICEWIRSLPYMQQFIDASEATEC